MKLQKELKKTEFAGSYTFPNTPLELYRLILERTRPEFVYQIQQQFGKYANNYSKLDELKNMLRSTGADLMTNNVPGFEPWIGSKMYLLNQLKKSS